MPGELISSNITDREWLGIAEFRWLNILPKKNARRCPVHPGAVLREDMLPASRKTKVEIARLLGISRQHLHDIMEEKKPLSPEVAVRVGKLFGGGAGIWVRMQAAHDTWHAEQTVDVSHIPTLKVA